MRSHRVPETLFPFESRVATVAGAACATSRRAPDRRWRPPPGYHFTPAEHADDELVDAIRVWRPAAGNPGPPG